MKMPMTLAFRPNLLLALVAVAALALSGAVLAEDADPPRTYPNLAAQLLNMEEVLVIDVRSEEEIDETELLARAIHVVHTDVAGVREVIGDDPGRTVIVYCGTGRRAGLVIDALREQGYTGLINAGGFDVFRRALDGGDEPREEEEEDGEDA